MCEMACSLHNDNVCNPLESSIRIIKWEEAGVDLPMVCLQCESPICKEVCPVGAIVRDESTGAVVIDQQLCVGCKLCVTFCPLGAVAIDTEGKIRKCQLCEGDPLCAKLCPKNAIEVIEAEKLREIRARIEGEKIKEISRIGVTSMLEREKGCTVGRARY